MALTAQQAQKKLDKHKIDGRAIGGFVVSNHDPDQDVSTDPGLLLFGAYWATKRNRGVLEVTRLVIVTNLGVAVGKTAGLGARRVTSWEIRPESEVRYELDPMEVRRGADTVKLTIGGSPQFASGVERDMAFRLYSRQPVRRTWLTDPPPPSARHPGLA